MPPPDRSPLSTTPGGPRRRAYVVSAAERRGTGNLEIFRSRRARSERVADRYGVYQTVTKLTREEPVRLSSGKQILPGRRICHSTGAHLNAQSFRGLGQRRR